MVYVMHEVRHYRPPVEISPISSQVTQHTGTQGHRDWREDWREKIIRFREHPKQNDERCSIDLPPPTVGIPGFTLSRVR